MEKDEPRQPPRGPSRQMGRSRRPLPPTDRAWRLDEGKDTPRAGIEASGTRAALFQVRRHCPAHLLHAERERGIGWSARHQSSPGPRRRRKWDCSPAANTNTGGRSISISKTRFRIRRARRRSRDRWRSSCPVLRLSTACRKCLPGCCSSGRGHKVRRQPVEERKEPASPTGAVREGDRRAAFAPPRRSQCECAQAAERSPPGRMNLQGPRVLLHPPDALSSASTDADGGRRRARVGGRASRPASADVQQLPWICGSLRRPSAPGPPSARRRRARRGPRKARRAHRRPRSVRDSSDSLPLSRLVIPPSPLPTFAVTAILPAAIYRVYFCHGKRCSEHARQGAAHQHRRGAVRRVRRDRRGAGSGPVVLPRRGGRGTVAKTISAYDMTVSDAVYGAGEALRSRQRLQAMLDHEWSLLLERLDSSRGATRRSSSSPTPSLRGAGPGRRRVTAGWVSGSRTEPTRPSQIIIHARMWDLENREQQEAPA